MLTIEIGWWYGRVVMDIPGSRELLTAVEMEIVSMSSQVRERTMLPSNLQNCSGTGLT